MNMGLIITQRKDMDKNSKQRSNSNSISKRFELLFFKTHLETHRSLPVTMYKLGGLVHAPMNCTTFLCLTFLQVHKEFVRNQNKQRHS